MKENILSRLLTECPFSEVFEDMETVEGCSFPVPRRKIGHIRADYDGWRWYNTVWPCHKALATPDVCTEIDCVYDALTAPDALKDLAALRPICKPSFLSFAMIETRQEIFSWRGSEPLIRGRTTRHAEALSDH